MDEQKIAELTEFINTIPPRKSTFKLQAKRDLALAISNPERWATKCERDIRKAVADALWQTERGY